MRARHLALTLLAATPSVAATAQTITPVVKDGDMIAGAGTVTSIDNVDVNDSGTWLVRANTTSPTAAVSVVVRSGTPILHQGQLLVPPLGTLSSVDGFSINSAGDVAWNLFLSGLTTTTDSGVFFGTTLVIQESNLSTATSGPSQFAPNTPYLGWFDARINDSNQILMLASVDDPSIPSTLDRALVIAAVDGAGTLLSETVLTREGRTLPGPGTVTIADFSTGPHSIDFNNAGKAIYLADTDAPTTNDGYLVTAVPTTSHVRAREGDPSPVAGRNYETLLGKSIDIEDGGEFVFTANLDGATTDDEVIVKDAAVIVAREGSAPPGFPAFALTGFGSGAVRIDESSNVFWFGDWNDPDTTRDTGLFRNNQLLVQEGVTIVGTAVIEFISNVQDNFAISPDGRYLIFEGRLQGGVDAAFLMDLGGPSPSAFCFGDVLTTGVVCPCGFVGQIGVGCPNSLNPLGANLMATSGGWNLSNDTLVLTAVGVPDSSGLYFQGTGVVNGGNGAAFGDGLRCVGGTIVRLKTVNAVGGTSSYPQAGDPSISVKGMVSAAGVRRYQLWYRNAATYCTTDTFNLTNGVEVTWAP